MIRLLIALIVLVLTAVIMLPRLSQDSDRDDQTLHQQPERARVLIEQLENDARARANQLEQLP